MCQQHVFWSSFLDFTSYDSIVLDYDDFYERAMYFGVRDIEDVSKRKGELTKRIPSNVYQNGVAKTVNVPKSKRQPMFELTNFAATFGPFNGSVDGFAIPNMNITHEETKPEVEVETEAEKSLVGLGLINPSSSVNTQFDFNFLDDIIRATTTTTVIEEEMVVEEEEETFVHF